MGEFVGTVAGTPAFVAIVAAGDEIEAYVCDGKRGIATTFAGEAADGGETTLSAEDGSRIEIRFGQGSVTGTIEGALIGRRGFTADPAEGRAGWYRTATDDERLRIGWIVLGDGRFRGALTSPSAVSFDSAIEAMYRSNWQTLTTQTVVQNRSATAQLLSNLTKTKSDAELNAIRNVRP